MNRQLTIDEQIEQSARQAEIAEADARSVDQRMRLIPALSSYLSGRRAHGVVRNPWVPATANLTAQSAILANDPQLATWLANKAGMPLPGPDYLAIEQQQQATEQAHKMAHTIEAMRQANAAAQQERYRRTVYGRKPAGAR